MKDRLPHNDHIVIWRKKTLESFYRDFNLGFINHRWKGVVMGRVAESLVLVVLTLQEKASSRSSFGEVNEKRCNKNVMEEQKNKCIQMQSCHQNDLLSLYQSIKP